MLQYRTIDTKTLELLKEIQRITIFKNLRLVGGTSLALQIGHRISIDLDLFGKITADEFTILNTLRELGDLKIINTSENIKVFLISQGKRILLICLSVYLFNCLNISIVKTLIYILTKYYLLRLH